MNRMLTVLLIVVLAFLLSGCDALKEKTVENSAPVIEGDGSLIFSINSEEPDWTKLVTVIDDEDGAIRVNESMVDEDVNFTVAGIYDVRYYVPDSGGKSTLFIITVEIIDDRVYTFELIGSNEINIEVFNEYSDLGVLALDLEGNEATVYIEGTVDSSTVGEYSLIYRMDNVENTLSRIVHVIDTTAPVVEVDTVKLLFGQYSDRNWLEYVDSVTDNYSENIILEVVSSNVDFESPGSYEVTIAATDEFGNESNTSFTVRLDEVILLINGDAEVSHEVFTDYLDIGAIAIDKDLNQLEVEIQTNVNVDVLGSYTVTYTVLGYDDIYVSRTVNVVDTTPPEVTVGDQLLMRDIEDVDWSDYYETLTDNYDNIIVISEIQDNVVYGTPGEYTVTLEAKDTSNNISTVTFTVTIPEYINLDSAIVGTIDVLIWSGSGTYWEDLGHQDLVSYCLKSNEPGYIPDCTPDLFNQNDASAYAVAKAFNEIYPNVRINVLAMAGGPNDGGRIWSQQLEYFRATYGVHPSIWTSVDLVDDVSKGIVADLSRFYFDPIYQSINPTILSMMNYYGFQAGLPQHILPWGIYVNKELAESYNIDIPSPNWTIEEYTTFIANSESNVYYGSMDTPIRIIETGTNDINRMLFEYDGGDEFVNLNSDEVRYLIPYINQWNEHSVWGNDTSIEFFNQNGGGWAYSWFKNGTLLTLETDPWMMGDCASQDTDWGYKCVSSDWDIYPRPSTDFATNTLGIVLDPMAVYNYCLEDGNLACSEEEELKIKLSYTFASFMAASTESFEARSEQVYTDDSGNIVSALNNGFPITNGERFDEQMQIWYTPQNHQRFSDPLVMPGFHEVLRIYKAGQFWDVSDKSYPTFHYVEGSRRENLYEWKRFWDSSINGGYSKGDIGFTDAILNNLYEWNLDSNTRYTESFDKLKLGLSTYYGYTSSDFE